MEWVDNVHGMINGREGSEEHIAKVQAHKKLLRLNMNPRWREI